MVDISEMNTNAKNIEAALQENESAEELEQQYGCRIIMMDALYQAYENGDTIFDYIEDGQM